MATTMSPTLINTIFTELCNKAGKAKSIKLDIIKEALENIQVVPDIVIENKKTKGKRKSKKDPKDPNAPKKEPTTYNLFVKAFINKHRDEYDDHKLRFAAASKAWTNTSDDDNARETLLKEYNVISNGSEKKETEKKTEKKETEKKDKKKDKKTEKETEKKDDEKDDTPPPSPNRRLPFPVCESDEDEDDDEDEE